MPNRYPTQVRSLNDRLGADLGSNPRYAWRWADDILHVMELVDGEGLPIYIDYQSPAGLTIMTPATQVRKLLPQHENCWVLCALIEVNKYDGSLQGTGMGSWIPVSGPTGPVALLPHEKPDLDSTIYVIDTIRRERNKSAVEMGLEWEGAQARAEKSKWNRAYDQIRDAATAFYSIPGAKAHVSFPSRTNDTNLPVAD